MGDIANPAHTKVQIAQVRPTGKHWNSDGNDDWPVMYRERHTAAQEVSATSTSKFIVYCCSTHNISARARFLFDPGGSTLQCHWFHPPPHHTFSLCPHPSAATYNRMHSGMVSPSLSLTETQQANQQSTQMPLEVYESPRWVDARREEGWLRNVDINSCISNLTGLIETQTGLFQLVLVQFKPPPDRDFPPNLPPTLPNV
jgi:hypothetical protein